MNGVPSIWNNRIKGKQRTVLCASDECEIRCKKVVSVSLTRNNVVRVGRQYGTPSCDEKRMAIGSDEIEWLVII